MSMLDIFLRLTASPTGDITDRSMTPKPALIGEGIRTARWLFLTGYVFACVLFWWAPYLLMSLLGFQVSTSSWTISVGVAAFVVFVVVYLLPQPRLRSPRTSVRTLEMCAAFSYRATILWAIPAFMCAAEFGLYRWGQAYGEGQRISFIYQAVLYVHLFLGFLFLGAASDEARDRRRILIVAGLITLPRLFISLHWGRFFLAQALIPIMLIAIARGWIKISFKRFFLLSMAALFVLIVPAVTRGDSVFGGDEFGHYTIVNFLYQGSTMKFFEDNRDLPWTCPPLLVSITSKVIPYSTLNVCVVDVGDDKRVPATLDVLLTKQYSDDLLLGTGGVYLLDLYLLGGIPAIIGGTAIFAFTCKRFVDWIGHRSLYAGIWAECLSRAFLAPRGNLGYIYERIPSLVLATLLVVLACRIAVLLKRSATGTDLSLPAQSGS